MTSLTPSAATSTTAPTATASATATARAGTARATAGRSLLTKGPALCAPLSGLIDLAAAVVHVTERAAWALRAGSALGRPAGTADTTRATKTTNTADAPHAARPTCSADASHTARATRTADASHAPGTTRPPSTPNTAHAARPTGTADASHAAGATRACRRPHRIAGYGDLRTAGKARRSARRAGEIASPPTPSAPAPTV
jgi:hypothetical protein